VQNEPFYETHQNDYEQPTTSSLHHTMATQGTMQEKRTGPLGHGKQTAATQERARKNKIHLLISPVMLE
jgi:hypothetical protein